MQQIPWSKECVYRMPVQAWLVDGLSLSGNRLASTSIGIRSTGSACKRRRWAAATRPGVRGVLVANERLESGATNEELVDRRPRAVSTRATFDLIAPRSKRTR